MDQERRSEHPVDANPTEGQAQNGGRVAPHGAYNPSTDADGDTWERIVVRPDRVDSGSQATYNHTPIRQPAPQYQQPAPQPAQPPQPPQPPQPEEAPAPKPAPKKKASSAKSDKKSTAKDSKKGGKKKGKTATLRSNSAQNGDDRKAPFSGSKQRELHGFDCFRW